QRIARPDELRVFQIRFPRERADAQEAVGLLDVREPGNSVDVDDVLRGGQAELHERDETLATGQHLRVVAKPGEQPCRLADRCGSVVLEGGRNHRGPPWPAAERGPSSSSIVLLSRPDLTTEKGESRGCGPRAPGVTPA